MSEHNPFAPPAAEVADVVATGAAPPPALWNPGAAASWSLILTPVFGAFLHMRNWQALGEPAKAANSKRWVMVCAAFLIAMTFAPFLVGDTRALDLLARAGALALLIGWYYALGKSQQAFVVARYGKNYPRRGWTRPLLAAVGAFVALVLVILVLVLVSEGLADAK